jgi:hypothetical protein
MELDQAIDIIDMLARHGLHVDQADYLDALSTIHVMTRQSVA